MLSREQYLRSAVIDKIQGPNSCQLKYLKSLNLIGSTPTVAVGVPTCWPLT